MKEITKNELGDDIQFLGEFVRARVMSVSDRTGELVLELHCLESVRDPRKWRLSTNARALLDLADMLQRQIAPTSNHKIHSLLSSIDKKLDR